MGTEDSGNKGTMGRGSDDKEERMAYKGTMGSGSGSKEEGIGYTVKKVT